VSAALGLAFAAHAEVQTTLNMTAPALTMGSSGSFSSSQATGPSGTNAGTVLHSYAGIERLTQTSGTGRFALFDGTVRYGIEVDGMKFFQSFISPNYLTLLNSGTTCPASGTYNWIRIRYRTPDAFAGGAMNTNYANFTIGGRFTYTTGTSAITGSQYFNLTGPSTQSSPSYSIANFGGACSNGKNMGTSTGTVWDRYQYLYYGSRNIAMVSSHGNPEVIMAAPVQTLTGNMAPLANFVFTGLYTYFTSRTTQTRENVYLYPNAAGTTYTIRRATSLTDPTQYVDYGTLTCTTLDSPITGFCSGTLALVGVSGTGKAVCMVSIQSTENMLMCSAQYPTSPSNAVTIIAKTVRQAVLQVTMPSNVARVTNVGNSQILTATVTNLSSRHVPTIGNPGGGLDLTAPWSNTGAYSGGSNCSTSLRAYSSCTFPVTFTSTGIGTNTTNTLRVAYNNGIGTVNATLPLIGVTGLVSIAITPTANQNNLTTTQLTATATYSNSATQNISSIVTWSSSNEAVGTVSTTGLASWLSTGSTTMTATLGTASGTRTLTVVAPVVLTAVTNRIFPSNYLNQGANFTQNFNNIAGGTPGNDAGMTYSCVYDRVVDGVVSPGTACTSLPGTISFTTNSGIFNWTPNAEAFGPYEISVTGINSGNPGRRIFIVDVRPPYTLTNLRANFEAQFADLGGPNTAGDYIWQDLTANNYDGTLNNNVNGTWVGTGAYSSPYALSVNGSAAMDFGTGPLNGQTRMVFNAWVNPASAQTLDGVLFGNSNNGAGNGFTVRQSRTTPNRLDFTVGVEDSYLSTVINHSPLAYWRLNESSGTTFNDMSGTFDLTLAGTGTQLNQTGALVGDSDASIKMGGTSYACHAPAGSLTGSFTVEAWVYPGSSSGALGIAGSRTPSDFGFSVKYQSGQFRGQIGNGTSWITTAADTTASNYTILNAWYHVVYVVTTTGYTIYVNGVNAGSGTYAASTPLLANASHHFCVGGTGANLELFTGQLDEVAVYNSALSGVQVLSHYNNGRTYHTTVVADSPVGYWRMGETSGATLSDATPSGYDLTLAGSGQVYNQTGAITNDTNGALGLGGAAYGCRSGAGSLTGNFTVEAWVYPTSAVQLSGIVGSRAPGENSFDLKYQSGRFHGDVGNGSAWLSTAVDTPTSYTTLNTWYHVVYAISTTGYTIYLNGVNAGSGSWTGTPVLFDGTHNLCIGSSGGNFEQFMGKIDEVAIYNYTMTGAQALSHYNTGISALGLSACTSTTALSSNQWNFISGLYDGTNVTMYVNARPECTIAASGTFTTPASSLVAGATSAGANSWIGLYSDVKFYTTSNGTNPGTATDMHTNFISSADKFREDPVGNIVTSGIVWHLDAANAARGTAFPGIGIGQLSWFDLSASLLDGTLSGFSGSATARWVGTGAPTSAYALSFDGSATQVTSSYTQTAVTAYSVEVWVKTSDTGAQRTFVHNRGTGLGRSLTLGIGTTGGGHGGAGRIGWELDSDAIDIGISSNNSVADGNWHHVVGTWAANTGVAIAQAQFRIYIDGALATSSGSATGSFNSPLTGLGGTVVGAHGPWATFFNGQLAKVAIYNRQLTLAEVSQNCKALQSRFSGVTCS